MEPCARITQKEIAERLRLSQTTVSRALNRSPLLSEETIRRVLAVVDQIGYRPDPALAGLNSYRHAKRPISNGSVIAWLGKYAPARMSDDTLWDARVLRAARKRGEQLGYKVDYFWLHDLECSLRRLQEIFLARSVLGLVLDTQLRSYSHLPFRMEHFCAVSIGRTLYAPKLDQVSPNHFDAVVSCYRHLRGRGLRRIGLAISRSFDERSHGRWYAGFLLEQLRKQARPAIPILDCEEANEKSFAKWIRTWKPDGLITALESPSYRELPRVGFLRKLGKTIPGDISVALVNINDTDVTRGFGGVVEPLNSIGIAAIDILVNRIRNNIRGSPDSRISSLIEGKWRDGKSIRPPTSERQLREKPMDG